MRISGDGSRAFFFLVLFGCLVLFLGASSRANSIAEDGAGWETRSGPRATEGARTHSVTGLSPLPHPHRRPRCGTRLVAAPRHEGSRAPGPRELSSDYSRSTEITFDESGNSWTYNAKDDATGAAVSVRLTREPCSDPVSDAKYTFSVIVNHAQIGALKGCGVSSPDKFPEFRKKNQLDMPDDATDKTKESDKDKEREKKLAVLDPITNFHPPVAVAYIDSSSHVIVSRGAVKKTAALSGTEPALSHNGNLLLYTRSDSKSGPERSILLYDFDTGRARELAGNNVRQAFWSPDDTRIAYLKFDGKIWQVWTTLTAGPENATLLSSLSVDALHGWVSPNTLLATDAQNAYWISEDKPAQAVPLKEIYGDVFEIRSGDTVRVCPVNPDLLLVSAYYRNAPAGAPTDPVGLDQTFFLYELRSHRRTILGPPDTFARSAEWSRDGLQIFFTQGVPGRTALPTDRVFWDGTGLKRYVPGSNLVVGK